MEAVRVRTAAVDDVARRALTALDGLAGVHRAGLALLEGGGRRLRFTASDRLAGDLEWCYIDAYDDVPLTSVVRSGAPVAGSLTDLDGRYPEFVACQEGTATAAVVAVPLREAGAVLGGIVVYLEQSEVLRQTTEQVTSIARAAAAGLVRGRRDGAGRATSSDAGDQAVPVARNGAVTLHVADAAGVAGARHQLHDLLRERDVDADVVDSAVLCLSEVVTNAVMHAAGPAFVRVSMDGDVLRVAVRNGEGQSGDLGTEDLREPLRVHGRGLQVVDALSSRWGYDSRGIGTTVWFEVACSARA